MKITAIEGVIYSVTLPEGEPINMPNIDFSEAISIVQDLLEKLDLPNNPENLTIPINTFLEFNQRLRDVAPFDSIKGTFLLHADGGGMSGDVQIFVDYVYECGRLGMSPKDIIELAHKQIVNNEVVVVEVSDIRGLLLKETIKIDEETWLCPNSQVPAHRFNKQVFGDRHHFSDGGRSSNAAYCRRVVLKKAMISRTDMEAFDRENSVNTKAAEGRVAETRDLIRALVLASDESFDTGYRYLVTTEPNILASTNHLISSPLAKDPIGCSEVNFDRVFEILDKLKKFAPKAVLDLAVDRLSGARGMAHDVNSAIDLGIALEVLLMHDDPRATTEINFKIGLRAGWLLGSNAGERRAFKKLASTLYTQRSNAAHKGRVDPDWDRAASLKLVNDICLTMLDRGKFPDWIDLTFGSELQ